VFPEDDGDVQSPAITSSRRARRRSARFAEEAEDTQVSVAAAEPSAGVASADAEDDLTFEDDPVDEDAPIDEVEPGVEDHPGGERDAGDDEEDE
jgi:hypothetical protein